MDASTMLLLSGTGDVIEPDVSEGGSIVAIGSGGSYALAAGRVLLKHTQLTAPEICREALRTAGEICVFTNTEITVEEIGA
jgi:ATP-dependent HslUV protease subunit HslV